MHLAEMESDEMSRMRSAYVELEHRTSSHQVNSDRQQLLRERDHMLKRMLAQQVLLPISQCRVLDVGCGYGGLLGQLHELRAPAANLFGMDLLPKRVETAQTTYPALASIPTLRSHCFGLLRPPADSAERHQ